MPTWEEKRLEIAKAREFIVLTYIRDVKKQNKIPKGAAEKKLLVRLKSIWFDKNLSVLGEKVPTIGTIKNWYDDYEKSENYLNLVPDYGKSLGKSIIPQSHKDFIINELSRSKVDDSKIEIAKRVKKALHEKGLSAEYSEATLFRFIKANQNDLIFLDKKTQINKRLNDIETELKAIKIGCYNNSGVIEIPLFMHAVCAGVPSITSDEVERYISVPKEITKNPESTWAVRANGDSMIGAGIESGDILIADNKSPVKNRCIVIASINGSQTVKRINILNGSVVLSPENTQYDPISLKESDELIIFGTVLGIYRSLY